MNYYTGIIILVLVCALIIIGIVTWLIYGQIRKKQKHEHKLSTEEMNAYIQTKKQEEAPREHHQSIDDPDQQKLNTSTVPKKTMKFTREQIESLHEAAAKQIQQKTNKSNLEDLP